MVTASPKLDLTAFVPVGEKRFRERFGVGWEQFDIGQKFRHRPGLTLSQQDSRDECLDTLNAQMLHFDQKFAGHTEWKKCLMDSTLTAKVVLGMTWKTFARRERIIGFDEITLNKPVFGGDTLYAESEILGKAEDPTDASRGTLKVCTVGVNQTGEMVAKLVYDLVFVRGAEAELGRVKY
ncbi:MAG TPA: MaoC/PaaZ C-terminal domain-containing protein [Opitutaceae bacterium]|nr:MaoC/PaaZ C-terminal domain-containing protein [Opitutaceae bacterium]